MAYNPLNPNSQATMANSQPVVIASNQSPVSVTGTILITGIPSISGQVGASIIGTVPVVQVTNPWVITGSVQASITPAANQSVSGTVGASVVGTVPTTQAGTWISSIVSTVPSSVLVGASIMGLTPVNVTTLAGNALSVDVGNTNTGTARMIQATGSTFNTGQVTIASTATSILGVNVNRIRAVITNVGTNPVYLGSSSVLSSITGTLLAGIAGYPILIRSSSSVWGTSPAGNQIVTFLEEVK